MIPTDIVPFIGSLDVLRPFIQAEQGGASSLLFMPQILSTVDHTPMLTHTTLGSGMRRLPDGWDAGAAEALHVAISWACVNASLLKGLTGSRGRGSVFASTEDLWMITNRTDIDRKGGSLGACAALALCCRITNYKRREDYHVGVSATLDLRGRLGPVGSLDKKATHAHSGGLDLVVVSSSDQKALEAEECIGSGRAMLDCIIVSPQSSENAPVVSIGKANQHVHRCSRG